MLITIKGITDEDFINYKDPSMFIAFPKCSFKCGADCCQNSSLALSGNIEVESRDLVNRYLSNPITSALICGGLEPFDSFMDLFDLIFWFREKCNDPVVIYSGYTEEELKYKAITLANEFDNIIIKYGRYIPGKSSHHDDILGVDLASNNQYAVKIS